MNSDLQHWHKGEGVDNGDLSTLMDSDDDNMFLPRPQSPVPPTAPVYSHSAHHNTTSQPFRVPAVFPILMTETTLNIHYFYFRQVAYLAYYSCFYYMLVLHRFYD